VVINKIATAITLIHAEGNLEEWDTYEVYEEELQSVANYLTSLPHNISEELLQSILSTEELDVAIRFCILKLMFHNHIKSLIVGAFPKDYYMTVLDIIGDHGAELQTLDLRGVWVKGDEAKKLQHTLEKLPNLKELYIPHVASNGILAALGRDHGSLLVLDISGACNISWEGIEMLCCAPSSSIQPSRLQVVNIGSPGQEDVSPSNITTLLKNLPDLRSLGGYSFVGKALLNLISKDGGIVRETKLQYLHDTGTDLDTLDAIRKLCPKLESVYLDRPTYGVVGRLHSISKLKQVKLNRFDCAELDLMLTNCGVSLETLELLVGKGMLDMSSVASHCPQLKKLTCYKIEFLTHYEQVIFPSLTKLEVLHSVITTSCIRYLLSSSPQIEEFSIGEHVDLTDNDFADILGKTALPQLRKLWFQSARNLSRITVEVLMVTCPSLKSIALVSGWGLGSDDIQDLLYEIQISNLDLALLEFFAD
jgi:Leucine-rich repeat (LRR) protein